LVSAQVTVLRSVKVRFSRDSSTSISSIDTLETISHEVIITPSSNRFLVVGTPNTDLCFFKPTMNGTSSSSSSFSSRVFYPNVFSPTEITSRVLGHFTPFEGTF